MKDYVNGIGLNKEEWERWSVNRILNAVSCFKKAKCIDNIKFTNEENRCFGTLSVTKFTCRNVDNIIYSKQVVELEIAKKIAKHAYKFQLDNEEDFTFTELDFTTIHEITHINNMKHNKKFYKQLYRNTVKWMAFVYNKSQRFIKDNFSDFIKKELKSDRLRNFDA